MTNIQEYSHIASMILSMWDKRKREIEVDGKANSTTEYYLDRNIEMLREMKSELDAKI
jgi:hypothetical protein